MLILAQSLSAAQHPTKSCSQMMATAACTTDCSYIKQSMDLTQRKSLEMILVVKIVIKLKNFNGLNTLLDSNMGTDLGSDSKPDGCIALCRTCSHCTDSDSGQKSESESIPISESGNVFKP